MYKYKFFVWHFSIIQSFIHFSFGVYLLAATKVGHKEPRTKTVEFLGEVGRNPFSLEDSVTGVHLHFIVIWNKIANPI